MQEKPWGDWWDLAHIKVAFEAKKTPVKVCMAIALVLDMSNMSP